MSPVHGGGAQQVRAAHEHRPGAGVLPPERLGGRLVADQQQQRPLARCGDRHAEQAVVLVVEAEVAGCRVPGRARLTAGDRDGRLRRVAKDGFPVAALVAVEHGDVAVADRRVGHDLRRGVLQLRVAQLVVGDDDVRVAAVEGDRGARLLRHHRIGRIGRGGSGGHVDRVDRDVVVGRAGRVRAVDHDLERVRPVGQPALAEHDRLVLAARSVHGGLLDAVEVDVGVAVVVRLRPDPVHGGTGEVHRSPSRRWCWRTTRCSGSHQPV